MPSFTPKSKSADSANGIFLSLPMAAKAIIAGSLVLYPTETFYAIGCDAFNEEAVSTIYTVKKRPLGLPLPVILPSISSVNEVAVNISDLAKELMRLFWPSALTILFSASSKLPLLLTAGTGVIAARVSPHPATTALCTASERIITASSANITGFRPARSVEDINAELLVVAKGVLVSAPEPQGGLPSTIVRIVEKKGKEYVLINRQGVISQAEIEQAGLPVITEYDDKKT